MSDQNPIVIFGVGGSGTRVIAEVLKKAGCYLGKNLNRALDNLDFGLLLAGRIRWMEKNFPFTLGQADPYLKLFDKINFKKRLNARDWLILSRIISEYISGTNRQLFTSNPLRQRIQSAGKILRKKSASKKEPPIYHQRWGFKSPPSIFLLNGLHAHYRGAQFIHLVRDGRDIALSTNRKPVLYRHILPAKVNNPEIEPYYHWCRANHWAHQVANRTLPPDQYLLMRYEDICRQPRRSVDRLLAFTGIKAMDVSALYRIPRPNPSIGRWKNRRELFTDIDESPLALFGYK